MVEEPVIKHFFHIHPMPKFITTEKTFVSEPGLFAALFSLLEPEQGPHKKIFVFKMSDEN
jgi:hypothetical protein